MNIFPELVRTNIPFILLLLIALLAFSAAWWLYRKSPPSVSNTKKYILTAFRSMLFFLIVLLLFSPTLYLLFQEEMIDKTAVFIDNSFSMQIREGGQERWQQTRDLVRKLRKISSAEEEWKWYSFNSQINEINADSLKPSRGGTNFEQVVQFIKKNGLQKAFIISDGNYTEGVYPLSRKYFTDCKIFTIGMGQKEDAGDVFISDVVFEKFIYQGKMARVSVEVGSRKLREKVKLRLKLMQGRIQLATRFIDFDSSNSFKRVELQYTPQSLGLGKFTAIIEPFPQEANIRNNRYSFTQETLKAKVRIAIFSGSPGYESKFIHFLLGQEADFVTRLLAEDRRGNFIGLRRPVPWDSLDVFILQDYPGKNSRKQILDRIAKRLGSGKAGAVFYFGKNADLSKLDALRDFLPFKSSLKTLPNPVAASVYEPQISPRQTLLNLFDDRQQEARYWRTIPPLELYYKPPQFKKGTAVLLQCVSGRQYYPALIAQELKGNTFFTFMGQGFWKWHFLLQDETGLQSGYQNLLKRVIRRLANRSELKRVTLECDAKTTNSGKKVRLKGHIYNSAFQRLKEGEMTITVRQGEEQFQIPVQRDSSGRFSAQFIPVNDGRYKISAEGYHKGVYQGKDSLIVEAMPMEKEFLHPARNDEFLKKLAAVGSGFYVSANGIDSLESQLHPATTRVQRQENIELWYQPLLLILIIVLVTIEWLLRKRWGLV